MQLPQAEINRVHDMDSLAHRVIARMAVIETAAIQAGHSRVIERASTRRPDAPSLVTQLTAAFHNSQHDIRKGASFRGFSYHCADCGQSCAGSAHELLAWVTSTCHGSFKLVRGKVQWKKRSAQELLLETQAWPKLPPRPVEAVVVPPAIVPGAIAYGAVPIFATHAEFRVYDAKRRRVAARAAQEEQQAMDMATEANSNIAEAARSGGIGLRESIGNFQTSRTDERLVAVNELAQSLGSNPPAALGLANPRLARSAPQDQKVEERGPQGAWGTPR